MVQDGFRTETASRLLHPAKALAPISVTVFGMETLLFRFVQFSKALASILTRFAGSETSIRAVQPEKA